MKVECALCTEHKEIMTQKFSLFGTLKQTIKIRNFLSKATYELKEIDLLEKSLKKIS